MADSKLVTSTVKSPNYNSGRLKAIRLIVIHTMESNEAANTAENVAAYFAKSTTRASSHYLVDNNSTVQAVAEKDTAWAAPGANADGIQIEQAGSANQGAAAWKDAYSAAMLDRTARLIADIATRRGIPIRQLTNAQLAAGQKGIIGHVQASQVYKLSTHTDPGSNYPWASVLAAAKKYAGQTSTSSGTTSTTTSSSGKISTDGLFGDSTRAKLRQVTKTKDNKAALKALQKALNDKGAKGYDGKKLAVDGVADVNNTVHDTKKQNTNYAWQVALGMPVKDGVFSHNDGKGSDAVRKIQSALNNGKLF